MKERQKKKEKKISDWYIVPNDRSEIVLLKLLNRMNRQSACSIIKHRVSILALSRNSV